ncbi:SAYSvFN domain-containing protein 1 [Notolabrus celidotus]|uniref:SAYSvFN domain-containing protein 1 n=1 Tax=Notolabrus celidotus TaxID=1203425 RepID=UPI00148FBF04|nr:SAYSvFN domain-containing protein 1 [Notolabrus celidotus]XP_034555139.1 SAYSvFN domain-containing protein 1 [Notolabrus celidotus]
MEQKLAEFRARRQAAVKEERAAPQTTDQTDMETSPQTDSTSADSQHTEEKTDHRDSAQSSEKDKADWLLDNALGRWLASRHLVMTNLTLLKVLLWLVLLGLFVELEFGLPFFIISLFYWLYEGLRSPADREPGELSAYSVFNPDCQPLLGTLTAEQLEGEMGYRPLTNR